ncbi:sulfur reduction protein DsrE [Ornatilinea apprima]|uniref:Sulfur reduction protein DsrE n=1 Tax=Ornatilinea apprima TaxID=1134406 RepID=A0A0N8GKK9_9CHLR|nr:DsrE family protein [Ornatilinea apprima]KPL69986.1 sulfur reduction protein DsrE [Ornatilinea apprima]
MKITIQVMVPPYTNQDLDTALNIAEACLDRGHEVRLFLFSDSILSTNTKVKPVRSDRNIPERMRLLIEEKKLRVDICGICMEYRGVRPEDAISGAAPSGLPELASLVVTSDRFVNLMA